MTTRIITNELPSSLLRLGIGIAFSCIGIFCFIAWLLEYQDTLEGPITITTPTLPVDIHAPATGKLQLLQSNEIWVQRGTLLAYIDNTTSWQIANKLLELQADKHSYEFQLDQVPSLIQLLDKENLGSLRPSLVALSRRFADYQFFLRSDQHEQIIQAKQTQIQLYQHHSQLSNTNIQQHKKSTALAQKELAVDRKLYEEDIISKRQLDQAERKYNDSSIGGRLVDFQTAISKSQIEINKEQEEILQIKNQFIREKEQLYQAILTAYQLFQKDWTTWQEQYLIKADIAGQIIYSDLITDYNYVEKGMHLMTLLPNKNQEYMGLIQLPRSGYSKLQKGQTVQIKLDPYPFEEFGIILGEVTAFATIPQNDRYQVQVRFPNGLRSTYNIEFDFRQRMTGQAAIVTNRISLWQRIQNQIRSTRLNDQIVLKRKRETDKASLTLVDQD